MLDLENMNNCLKACGRPLEYQNEYALSAYAQFNMNLQNDLQKCLGQKDEQGCIEKVNKEYSESKISKTKADYEEYLQELIKRKWIKLSLLII